MDTDFNALTADLTTKATRIGLKVLGALALWIIGGWMVRIGTSLMRKAMAARKLDRGPGWCRTTPLASSWW